MTYDLSHVNHLDWSNSFVSSACIDLCIHLCPSSADFPVIDSTGDSCQESNQTLHEVSGSVSDQATPFHQHECTLAHVICWLYNCVNVKNIMCDNISPCSPCLPPLLKSLQGQNPSYAISCYSRSKPFTCYKLLFKLQSPQHMQDLKPVIHLTSVSKEVIPQPQQFLCCGPCEQSKAMCLYNCILWEPPLQMAECTDTQRDDVL